MEIREKVDGASDILAVVLYCIEDNEAIYINKSGNKISRGKWKDVSIAKRANGDRRRTR